MSKELNNKYIKPLNNNNLFFIFMQWIIITTILIIILLLIAYFTVSTFGLLFWLSVIQIFIIGFWVVGSFVSPFIYTFGYINLPFNQRKNITLQNNLINSLKSILLSWIYPIKIIVFNL
jgi:hypothetical protein